MVKGDEWRNGFIEEELYLGTCDISRMIKGG